MKKICSTLILLLCVGCASPSGSPPALNDSYRNDLALYALSLDGTPYQWGGESPDSGFDCSGFVRHVFIHTAGIHLPRTSLDMSQLGQEVSQRQLRPGDLVFFNTLRRAKSHVGIYLGNDRFIHAPRVGSSIRVDDMSQEYWRQHYDGARRV